MPAPASQLSPSSAPEGASAPVAWWGTIDTLWLLTAPLCTLLYSLLLPIAPNDFWYHVRSGWYISTHGGIPSQNLFSWGVPAQTPYLYQSWIAEWLLYVTLRRGLAWILVLRAVLLSLSIAILVWAAFRRAVRLGCGRSISAKGAAFGGLLGLIITSNNLDIRPQTFSVPLFALWLFVLAEWPYRGGAWRMAWGAALVLLMAFWANLHGAFPMGLIALGAAAAGGLAGPFLVRNNSGERPPRPDFSCAVICILATLAVGFNPHGYQLFGYVMELARLPAGHQFIEEWQPPRLDEWHSALFLLSPLVLLPLGLLAWKRDRDRPHGAIPHRPVPQGVWPGGLGAGEWLLGLGLYAMGANSVRAVLWFALWLPFAAGVIIASLAAGRDRTEPIAPPRPVQLVNAVLLAFLCLTPVPLLPWFKVALPWPPAFTARFARTPQSGPNGFPGEPNLLLDSNTPVRAAEFLRVSPPRGRLFCDMVMGSYVMWALFPAVKPYDDPRVELYPYKFWLDYRDLSLGKPGSDQELAGKGCTDALLDSTSQAGLVHLLRRSPAWELVAAPGHARLFRLRAAGPATKISGAAPKGKNVAG